MGKWLMTTGVLLFLVGAAWHFGGNFFRLGNLLGDFHFTKGNMHFYFPLGTSVVLSVLLTLFLYFLNRR